jgi:hypothetical protein
LNLRYDVITCSHVHRHRPQPRLSASDPPASKRARWRQGPEGFGARQKESYSALQKETTPLASRTDLRVLMATRRLGFSWTTRNSLMYEELGRRERGAADLDVAVSARAQTMVARRSSSQGARPGEGRCSVSDLRASTGSWTGWRAPTEPGVGQRARTAFTERQSIALYIELIRGGIVASAADFGSFGYRLRIEPATRWFPGAGSGTSRAGSAGEHPATPDRMLSAPGS